jgi:hypothetical protein
MSGECHRVARVYRVQFRKNTLTDVSKTAMPDFEER